MPVISLHVTDKVIHGDKWPTPGGVKVYDTQDFENIQTQSVYIRASSSLEDPQDMHEV